MDKDLQSVQQARDLTRRARAAADSFARADQAAVDRIVQAMGAAAETAASDLARLAVEDTGMGRYEDKVVKNLFSAVNVCRYILPLKTCGTIREFPDIKVSELAVPMGVVAALLPTTNPTSTAIYKALIAVKARNELAGRRTVGAKRIPPANSSGRYDDRSSRAQSRRESSSCHAVGIRR